MLSLRHTLNTDTFDPARRPVLIVPGYGMNSFIFSFHPRGTSMEASLAHRGFEVWSVDMRAQGKSRSVGGDHRYGLEDLIRFDLASAVRCVVESTKTKAKTLDLIGCSLGASMMFAYVVGCREHRVGRLVNMGGPVRWVKTPTLLSIAFFSPRWVGMLPIRGTRLLSKVALNALQKSPKLLSIYLHPEAVDMSQASQLTRTVENPNRHVNRDIAAWIKQKDLIIQGKNISEELKKVQLPLLTMVANDDGIVPRSSVTWPHDHIGSSDKEIVHVGSSTYPVAHADMFVSDRAPELVFTPLGDWLKR